MQETSDVLQLVPFDDWPLLKLKLKRDWPHFAYYHYWVDNAIKWKTREPNLEINIYCPDGKLDSGVFVGIESYSMYLVIPFAFDESKPLLRDCIIKTKLIDWSQGVVLAAVHEYFESAVREAIVHLEKTIQLKLHDDGPSNYYFKSKEDCLAVDVSIPEDMELKFLQESDVHLIHDLWPRKEVKENPEKSFNFVATLVRLNKGLGLFRTKDNKLVSWVLHSNCGGLALLQTLDECQGNGYAKIVVNAMSKHLASESLDVTLFIVKGNTASEKLFTSFNFKRINAEKFIVMRPLKLDD